MIGFAICHHCGKEFADSHTKVCNACREKLDHCPGGKAEPKE